MKLTPLFLLLTVLFSSALYAETCKLSLEVNDTMQFQPSQLEVSKSQCNVVTLTLKHSGALPKHAMGHNFVLTAAADAKTVAQAGWERGLENQYLPEDDPRIIAATDIIGGGESVSITFSTASLEVGAAYTFFCSFVGHYFAMNGVFILAS